MIEYPVLRLVYDRRCKTASGKPGTVEVEIHFQRKRKWLSTGVTVLPSQWHPDYKVCMHPDAHNLNLRIEGIEKPIIKFINELIMKEKPCTWEQLNDFIFSKKQDSENNFIEFVEMLIRTRKDIRDSTKKNHRKLLYALREFDTICKFSDLTRANVQKFDQWLHSRKDYRQTTIGSYHKFLKVYINEAIRRDLIKDSPYKAFKVDRGRPGLRKYLTPEDLSAIEDAEMPSPSFDAVRDVFVFQCYTGLSYADLYRFDYSNIIYRDGKAILHDVRQKSGEEYYIVLLSKAMEILTKYDFSLPVLSNQQYNMRLKIVAGASGINKNLTSHMARHTYASLCLNAGISIEVLAKMLGHTDIKTAQLYAKMLNTTVEKAYDELESKLCR